MQSATAWTGGHTHTSELSGTGWGWIGHAHFAPSSVAFLGLKNLTHSTRLTTSVLMQARIRLPSSESPPSRVLQKETARLGLARDRQRERETRLREKSGNEIEFMQALTLCGCGTTSDVRRARTHVFPIFLFMCARNAYAWRGGLVADVAGSCCRTKQSKRIFVFL